MSSSAAARVTARLKDGGWSLARTGKHQIWKHPNGATYPLSTTMHEGGRAIPNAFAQITRYEKFGPGRPTPGAPTTRNLGNLALTVLEEPAETALPETPLAVPEPQNGGEWLRTQREAAGLSRSDVADLMVDAFPGFNTSTIFAIESEGRSLSTEELAHLLTILDVLAPSSVQFKMASAKGLGKRRAFQERLLAAIDPVPTPVQDAEPLIFPETVPETVPETIEDPMPQLPNLSATRTDALALLTKACSSSMVSDEDVAAVLQEAREALKARAIANVAKDFE